MEFNCPHQTPDTDINLLLFSLQSHESLRVDENHITTAQLWGCLISSLEPRFTLANRVKDKDENTLFMP